jgi:hypothetical protein
MTQKYVVRIIGWQTAPKHTFQCIACQKEIYANDFGSIGGISITDTAGYGSRFDGEVFTLTCCDDCLEKGFINKREES